MKRFIKAGSTDQTLDIFVMDSSSAVGAGLTGLVYNSASLVCYYRRGATGSATQLTLATLATIGTAHADGGFKEVDATNMPGMYRLDLSDAIIAAGVPFVSIMLKGATNMAPVTIEIQLEQVPCDVTHWLGTAAATPTVAGVPEVDVTHMLGSSDAASILARWMLAGGVGTADSGTTTTLVDSNLTKSSNSSYVGGLLIIYTGTNAGINRRVISFDAGTDTVTVDEAFPSAIDATSGYAIIPDWAVDVSAEIASILAAILALLDDARTEPGQGAPPVNPDLATKIDYLYKAWRNRKTQTATTFSLYADDATTVDQKSTVSDNGTTFDAGEMATGP